MKQKELQPWTAKINTKQAEFDVASSERDALAKKAEAVRQASKEAQEALEKLQADQETKVREIMSFVGVPFDKRCLNFHENTRYARTASYAQVTEKLYDRSRYRYRNYLKQLAPVIPILEPMIFSLGYTIE